MHHVLRQCYMMYHAKEMRYRRLRCLGHVGHLAVRLTTVRLSAVSLPECWWFCGLSCGLYSLAVPIAQTCKGIVTLALHGPSCKTSVSYSRSGSSKTQERCNGAEGQAYQCLPWPDSDRIASRALRDDSCSCFTRPSNISTRPATCTTRDKRLGFCSLTLTHDS